MDENIQCPCLSTSFFKKDALLGEFAALREQCAVLKQIFVPDEIWPSFRDKCIAQPDVARHQSILLGAFVNGVINRITLPIHRYLLDGCRPKSTLSKQYKKDLIEKWIFEKEVIDRHRKARIFQGKLAELFSAFWIDAQGWNIISLEAIGSDFDIEAMSPNQVPCAIEVKFVGQEDVGFRNVLQSISSGKPFARCGNLYDGYNFFLFKAYEAAKQLLSCDGKRSLAFVIVSNMAQALDAAITVIGLDRRPFRFSENASDRWRCFLDIKKTENRFMSIESDLDETIGKLNELWIIEECNYFNYSLKKRLLL